MAQLPLDRKSLTILVIGAVLIVLLVFFAGYLVGLNSALADQSSVDDPPPTEPRAPERPEVREPEELPAFPTPPPERATDPAPEPPGEPVPFDDTDPPVEPPPPDPPPQVADQDVSADGDFTVQLGAFREESHAQGLEQDLLDLGFEPDVLRLDDAVLGTLYKVRVGRYTTFDEARQVAEEIQSQSGRDAWAVRVEG